MLSGTQTSVAFVLMTILGAGSSITALWDLNQLRNSASVQESQEFSLQKSTTVVSSPQGCFGAITTEGKKLNDDVTFTLNGSFSLSYQDTPYQVTLKGTASFNSLKQLNSSILEVSLTDTLLSFGTLGVNPIRFGASFASKEANYAHAISLPGPIMLEAKSPGRYSIKHADTGNISFAKFAPLLGSFYSSAITFQKTDKRTCDSNTATPYRTDTIVDAMAAVRHLLPKFEGTL
jgi:hypothetical protein